MINQAAEPTSIEHRILGLTNYTDGWDLQKSIHKNVVDGNSRETIISLQHYPVLTLGKNATKQNILISEELLEKSHSAKLVRADRGGEVTAHNPGQLVIYPIIKLGERRLSPKKFICLLEQSVIELLKNYGINAVRDSINPGVWVNSKKICATGVRIMQRVSMHGIALNIENDLSLFETIIPCGIADRLPTRIIDLLDGSPPPDLFAKIQNNLVNRITQLIENASISTS